MNIKRDEAISILAYGNLIKLTPEERYDILVDIYSENNEFENIQDSMRADYNEQIVAYYKKQYQAIINEFIENEILSIYHCNVNVIGEEYDFFACPCCGYKTLEDVSEYSICQVCYWEDDGQNEDVYSSVNHMTLKDAKAKFQEIGVISEEFLPKVNPKRFLMYRKS